MKAPFREPDDVPLLLPPRTRWSPFFPDVVIHTIVRSRDSHFGYIDAKSGDDQAASALVHDLISPSSIDELRSLNGRLPKNPILLPISALETAGFNAIPDAMGSHLGRQLGWRVDEIVQTNKVAHTRAKSFNRMVTPAAFEGRVEQGAPYVLVDDHVGLGGTLANLKGYVETAGGVVVGMTTLTESRDGRQIALRKRTLDMLWERHGHRLDTLWRNQFGHGLDCLTDVEGAILCRELSIDAIRARLAQAAVEARERGLDPVFRGT